MIGQMVVIAVMVIAVFLGGFVVGVIYSDRPNPDGRHAREDEE